MAAILLETGLHSSSIREFLEKVMNSLTVTKRLVLSKFTQMAVIKMCFFSLIDRINFWDFGGHADYDEIRVELYGQTQVRVKLMSSKKDLYNSYLTVYPQVSDKFPFFRPNAKIQHYCSKLSLAIFRCDITCQACQENLSCSVLTPFCSLK